MCKCHSYDLFIGRWFQFLPGGRSVFDNWISIFCACFLACIEIIQQKNTVPQCLIKKKSSIHHSQTDAPSKGKTFFTVRPMPPSINTHGRYPTKNTLPQYLTKKKSLIYHSQTDASSKRKTFFTVTPLNKCPWVFAGIVDLRILAIDDPKISQKLAFLGYWHKCIHGNTHLALQKCITCQVATIGSIVKFESKWLMSGRAPCIASILNESILPFRSFLLNEKRTVFQPRYN